MTLGRIGKAYDPPDPTTVWEHLNLLRFYGEKTLAEARLRMIAKHFDDPQWIKDTTDKWLNENQYWNHGYGYSSLGGYGYGWE